MKGINSEVIAEVRGRASLHEVIAEHVVLKRSGKDYSGLCPFHKEKSPSFTVSAEKGFFKCFGCGEGGDVFTFVQKFKGLDFVDAVKELALKYGVPLIETDEDRHHYDKRSALLMLYQQTTEYFAHQLADPVVGLEAREYLYRRGITDDIIEKFKLGYAPNSWDGLLNYLTTNTKAAPQTLEEGGLVVKRKEGSSGYFDFFRHRLMIPISDDQGRVIAFGGRAMGDDMPKYLNSANTPIYLKSQHLYAFHLAKEAIKKKDAVIVVEGYFDAITSHLHGFDNTVAVCGVALNEHQSKALVKFTESKRVYLAFDADNAGKSAVMNGSVALNQISEGMGLDLRVLRVPGGKDPDECLRSMDGNENVGPAIYAKALHEAPTFLDFQLNSSVSGIDLSTHIGKIDAAKNLVPVFSQMKNAVARGEYVRQWAMKLGIPEENLLSDVRQYRNNHRPTSQSEPAGHSKSRPTLSPSPSKHLISSRGQLMSGYVNSEQQLLALYLTSRDDHERVNRHMYDERLISEPHQRIKDSIEGIGSNFHTMEDLQSQLMDRLTPDSEALSAFVEVMLKAEVLKKQNLPVEKIIHEFRVRLLKERITRALFTLRSSLATSETDIDLNMAQGKIIQLNSISQSLMNPELSLEEIAILKRNIDEITSTSENPLRPEMSA